MLFLSNRYLFLVITIVNSFQLTHFQSDQVSDIGSLSDTAFTGAVLEVLYHSAVSDIACTKCDQLCDVRKGKPSLVLHSIPTYSRYDLQLSNKSGLDY